MKLNRMMWGVMLAIIVTLAGIVVAFLAGDSDTPQSVTFFAADDTYTITVTHPEDWYSSAQSDFGIGLTNDRELLQTLLGGVSATPQSGEISGNIVFFTYDNLGTSVGITAETDLETALAAFVQNISGGAAVLDDTELVTENDVLMATGVSSDDASDTLFIAVQIEQGMIFGFFGTITGELDQYRETLQSVMASSEFVVISDS